MVKIKTKKTFKSHAADKKFCNLHEHTTTYTSLYCPSSYITNSYNKNVINITAVCSVYIYAQSRVAD